MDTPRPSPRTNRTRRVPHPVLIGLDLHQATRDPVFLAMGADILASLRAINRAPCGYAATRNVETRLLEDRMDSYFLAETLKYLPPHPPPPPLSY